MDDQPLARDVPLAFGFALPGTALRMLSVIVRPFLLDVSQGLAPASCWADLFEISRRTRWPFHIQNPVRTSTGMETKRTTGA